MTIAVISFNEAKEFLDYLRLSDDRWWDSFNQRSTHVFRGHADASWKLLPSGWRPLAGTPLQGLFSHVGWSIFNEVYPQELPVADLAYCWRMTLAQAAIEFATFGRDIGLEIPFFIPGYRTRTKPKLTSDPRAAVPVLDMNLLALAQHHGIPTQLLDWTDDPLNAAYFASAGNSSGDLCVWALEKEAVEENEDNPLFSLMRFPNFTNQNLRAQSGLFLTARQDDSLDGSFTGEWPSIEQYSYLEPALTKIVLNSSERNRLFELLMRERRSRAHLMPSWEEAAQTTLERWSQSIWT